jgi:hypothetical protein
MVQYQELDYSLGIAQAFLVLSNPVYFPPAYQLGIDKSLD